MHKLKYLSARLLRFSWIVLASSQSDAQQYSRVQTISCGTYYSELGVIDAQGDLIEHTKMQARQFFESTERRGFAVRELRLARDEVAVRRLQSEKGKFRSYEEWRAWYQAPASEIFARAVAIGSSAVLDIDDGHGQAQIIVLSGSDPLLGRTDDADFELLRFAFRPLPERQQKRLGSKCTGEIFVRTNATMMVDSAAEIARSVLKRLAADDALIVIRNDDWFYDFRLYQAPSRLSTKPEPPRSVDDFSRLDQVTCIALRTGVNCN